MPAPAASATMISVPGRNQCGDIGGGARLRLEGRDTIFDALVVDGGNARARLHDVAARVV